MSLSTNLGNGTESDQMTSASPSAQPIEFTLETDSPTTSDSEHVIIVRKTWFTRLCHMLMTKVGHPLDAFAMLVSNQMSQMLVLLPYCMAKLGWWKVIVITAIFGFLSCWTAHLVQFFYFRYYRSESQRNNDPKNESVQWDKLLSDSFKDHGQLRYLGVIGMGFNCLCLFMRSAIQLTYAVSIIYFVIGKIEKLAWTIILAVCCLFFALFPTLRKYRIFSLLSFVIATLAALFIVVASVRYKPVKRVDHSVSSNSIQYLAWGSGTIIYALTDASASVETMVIIRRWDHQHKFRCVFLGSMVYAILLSWLEALISYWSFGNELSENHPGAQPCPLVVLHPSRLRDIASIFLLLLQLVAIGNTLHPIIMYMKRKLRLQPCRQHNHFRHGIACVTITSLVCLIAIAIPFLGSMEITSLVGSLIVSLAIYIIPAAAQMLYLGYSRHRMDVDLSSFMLIWSYMANITQSVGMLVFVAIIGGVLTGINKVFGSHLFNRSDFFNKCYLCAAQSQSPAHTPSSAPAPSQFVHFWADNISVSNASYC